MVIHPRFIFGATLLFASCGSDPIGPASRTADPCGAPDGCPSDDDAPHRDPLGRRNGEWIAVSGHDTAGRQQIFLVREDGTGRHQLTFDGNNGMPRWSPDGSRLVFSSDRNGVGGIFIMNADGTDPRQVLSRALVADWSSNDELVYAGPDARGSSQLFRSALDGARPVQLTHDSSVHCIHPAWSPDGERITFALITPDPSSPAGFNPEVWVIDRDGDNLTQVTTTDPDNRTPDGGFLGTAHDANAPDFGPNGWIAFWSGEEGSYGQVWKATADGAQRAQLTSTGRLTRNDDPTWSPDGRKILFSTDRMGGNQVWVMNADGTEARFVTEGGAGPFPGDAAWQPGW